MAINFPTSLDTLTNPLSTDYLNSPSHAAQHANANDIIEALEAKLGIDGSAVTTSHSYKLSGVTGSDKAASLAGNETLTNKIFDATSPTSFNFVGKVTACALRTAPAGWLLCDGSAISRSTYAALFAAIVPSIGAFTITIASPAVATLNAHGLNTGDPVYLTTTGALPTGLVANTIYYAIKIDANTFNLATTFANADAGTKINTSGSQSGVHTILFCPYGLGNGSTTFNVPNTKGSVMVGFDVSQAEFDTFGLSPNKGEKTHTLSIAEMPAHTHPSVSISGIDIGPKNSPSGSGKFAFAYNTSTTTDGALVAASNGSGGAHNNLQPYIVMNFIIKT